MPRHIYITDASPTKPLPKSWLLLTKLYEYHYTPNSPRLDHGWIAALCVCLLLAVSLLLLMLFLLRKGYTRWVAHHRKEVDLQGRAAMEMNDVRSFRK